MMNHGPESELLDVREAAKFLRLKPSTIRAWVLKRKLVHLKVGSRVFLRRLDLQQLLERCVVPATTNALDAFKSAGTSPPASAHKSKNLTVEPARGGAQ